jgi:hypothetical protein
MKRRPWFRATTLRLAVAGLVAVMFLSAACQSRATNNQDSAPGADARAANARTTDNQTGAATVNAGRQSSDNAAERAAAGPSIQITLVPSKGAGPTVMERIAGRVSGVNFKECKVVLFAHTDKWYVQPYTDSPDTPILAGGEWENDTFLGSEYAALLVTNSYKPPSTTETLPGVSGQVLAVARVAARK